MNAKSLVSVLCAAVIGVPGLAAADSVYDWSFNGGGISASGTVDVLNGFVQSATGTISGGGLPGSEALALITAGAPGTSVPDPANPVAGSFTFKTGGGDVYEGDTVWNANGPDPFGLVFAVGTSRSGSGAANYGFNPWVNSNGSVQGSLAGANGPEGRIYTVNQYGTFTVNAVPLPAALPLFLSGMGGLGMLGWRRRSAAAQ